MTSRVVIVGSSVGGVRTAQALRSQGYDGDIVLVGEETALPYDKPPLSKALLAGTSDIAAATLLTRDAAAADASSFSSAAARSEWMSQRVRSSSPMMSPPCVMTTWWWPPEPARDHPRGGATDRAFMCSALWRTVCG